MLLMVLLLRKPWVHWEDRKWEEQTKGASLLLKIIGTKIIDTKIIGTEIIGTKIIA